MKAVVFAGPSLYGPGLDTRSGVAFRPPARQGDVYRASQLRPQVIGIVDGYFEGVPSVWHKEILWALSQGIHVFGSASMGALRAAELDVFGMVGIGSIYEQYRDGGIEDDDEVALVHGPAETGFVPLTEPMVNVRATILAALRAGVIDHSVDEAITSTAKSLYYKQRQWRSVVEKTRTLAVDGASLARFEVWLKTGKVDQKRLDAEALTEAVSSALDRQLGPFEAEFRFEWTEVWDSAVREWDEGSALASGVDALSAAVIDELRLEPEQYMAVRSQAIQRAILLRHCAPRSGGPERARKLKHLARLRERLGLFRKADLDQWLEQRGLTPLGLERLLEEEVLLKETPGLEPNLVNAQILAVLRLSGDYVRLTERARRKVRTDARAAFVDLDEFTARVPPPVLLNWYFGQRLRQPVPDDLDGHVAMLGLPSRQAFYRLLAAEYVEFNK